MILELAVAAAVGAAAGLIGETLARHRHRLPRLVTMTIGAAAAITGTAAADSVREEPLSPILMLCAPLFFAGIAIAVAVTKLDRRAEQRAYSPTSDDRPFPSQDPG
ncbi:MAG TPA: hypothetical protein VGM20_02220 [Gemmatimonadales bacterium]